MTEVRDAGLSWKRSGNARSAPPLPGKEGEGAQQPKAQTTVAYPGFLNMERKGRDAGPS